MRAFEVRLKTDRRCDVWFGKRGALEAELSALRAILLSEGLEEAFKWRGPVYVHAGGNVAVLWAMASGAGIGFFKGVLLDDPEGLLEAPGPNSRSVRMMRVRDAGEVGAREAALRALIRQAMANEAAGLRPELPPDDFELPDALAERIDGDPVFAEAWAALTPGRRRGWSLHVGGAKQAATRERRLDKALPAILAGKGMHDR